MKEGHGLEPGMVEVKDLALGCQFLIDTGLILREKWGALASISRFSMTRPKKKFRQYVMHGFAIFSEAESADAGHLRQLSWVTNKLLKPRLSIGQQVRR